MMDMWNYLIDLYDEKYITIDLLENALTDDKIAFDLYDDYINDICMAEKIEWTRDEIKPVLEYLKTKNKK